MMGVTDSDDEGWHERSKEESLAETWGIVPDWRGDVHNESNPGEHFGAAEEYANNVMDENPRDEKKEFLKVAGEYSAEQTRRYQENYEDEIERRRRWHREDAGVYLKDAGIFTLVGGIFMGISEYLMDSSIYSEVVVSSVGGVSLIAGTFSLLKGLAELAAAKKIDKQIREEKENELSDIIDEFDRM